MFFSFHVLQCADSLLFHRRTGAFPIKTAIKRGITSKEQIGMNRENFLNNPLQSRTSENVADVLKNKAKTTTTTNFPYLVLNKRAFPSAGKTQFCWTFIVTLLDTSR